jgi:adenylate cyclase
MLLVGAGGSSGLAGAYDRRAGWHGRVSVTGARVGVKILIGIVFSALAGFLLVQASRAKLLPAAPDKFTYDWRTYLFAEQAKEPRKDIAILLVDEHSLKGYHYLSPIDRGMLAEIIKALDAAGAKAIGLDINLDRPTEPQKDKALIEAIKQSNTPIVMGAHDNRSGETPEELAFQEAFIAETGRTTVGHFYFAPDPEQLELGDMAIRYSLPASAEPPYRPALARALAEIDGPKPQPASNWIYWRLPPPGGGTELFPTFVVPAHRDKDGNQTRAVLPESWRSALAGKIVLVGGGFSDRDLHMTPLTVVSREAVHGVEIHAQILAQLRDGRSILLLPWWVEFLVAAGVTALGIIAAVRWTLKGSGAISTSIAFIAIVGAGCFLFWQYAYILPSATLFLAWAVGLTAGNYGGKAEAWLERMFSGEETKLASGG